MKRIFFLGIIVSMCIVSCSKDVGLTPPIPLGPDTVLHTDPADIYLVSPTGSYFPCSPIPMPLDTLFSDSIDVDSDGIYDLKFSDKHYIAGFSASDPCSNYHSQITASGMAPNIAIAKNTTNHFQIIGFDSSDIISSGSTYIESELFIKGKPYMMFDVANDFIGEFYMGTRMQKNGKTMYGWVRLEKTGLNGIIIKDYAINLTDGNPILAGQML